MSVIDEMFQDKMWPPGDEPRHLQWYPVSSWRCWCSGRNACHPSASGWPSCRRDSGPAGREVNYHSQDITRSLLFFCYWCELLRTQPSRTYSSCNTELCLTMRGEDLSMLMTVRLTLRSSRSMISWTCPLVGPWTDRTASGTISSTVETQWHRYATKCCQYHRVSSITLLPPPKKE